RSRLAHRGSLHHPRIHLELPPRLGTFSQGRQEVRPPCRQFPLEQLNRFLNGPARRHRPQFNHLLPPRHFPSPRQTQSPPRPPSHLPLPPPPPPPCTPAPIPPLSTPTPPYASENSPPPRHRPSWPPPPYPAPTPRPPVSFPPPPTPSITQGLTTPTTFVSSV